MLPSSGPDFCFGCCYLDSFFCALPIILAFVRAQTCLSLPSLSPVHQISAPITGTSSLVNSFPGTSCLPPCLASVKQLLYSAYLLRCLMHRQLICDSLSFIYSSSCLLNMYWMPPHVSGTIPDSGSQENKSPDYQTTSLSFSPSSPNSCSCFSLFFWQQNSLLFSNELLLKCQWSQRLESGCESTLFLLTSKILSAAI